VAGVGQVIRMLLGSGNSSLDQDNFAFSRGKRERPAELVYQHEVRWLPLTGNLLIAGL